MNTNLPLDTVGATSPVLPKPPTSGQGRAPRPVLIGRVRLSSHSRSPTTSSRPLSRSSRSRSRGRPPCSASASTQSSRCPRPWPWPGSSPAPTTRPASDRAPRHRLLVLRPRRVRHLERDHQPGQQPSPRALELRHRIAALSPLIMPIASLIQRRTGTELGSCSAVADSKQTLLCTYISAALLGLGRQQPVRLVVGRRQRRPVHRRLAVKEDVGAWRGDLCCSPAQVFFEPDREDCDGDACLLTQAPTDLSESSS